MDMETTTKHKLPDGSIFYTLGEWIIHRTEPGNPVPAWAKWVARRRGDNEYLGFESLREARHWIANYNRRNAAI